MEESRENYIKDCKADLNMKDVYQVANYYSIVTLLNAEVNSAEDFSRRMVEEMVKDGITQNRMIRIIEKSQASAEMREKLKQIAQSSETKSALRKVRVQANVAAENIDNEKTPPFRVVLVILCLSKGGCHATAHQT